MTSNELISVIVPIYNAEKYLDDCIRSITCQTYANIEILLVDDGSTDKSDERCKSWEHEDKRVRTIHQDNGGVSKARNTGIRNANGNLLIMVDSDDYISPDMITVLYDGYTQHNADIVICDYAQGENREYSFLKEPICFAQLDYVTVMNKVYKNGHDALRFISPWGKLYKKELFNGIQYPEGKIFEDIYVTHQLLYKANRIIISDQKLTYYFHHEDSIMHKPFHLGKLDYLDALKERIDFFKEHKLESLERNAYEEYLHSLIWEYSRVRDILHNKDERKEIQNRFREVYKHGYSSEKYPQDTATLLKTFNTNPELVILYWKIRSMLNKKMGVKK